MAGSARTVASKRLVVAGAITRDTTMLMDRIPEAGGSAIARELRVAAGGKGGTPAIVAAKLGARVHLLGAVGVDDIGDAVLRQLEGYGIELTHVTRCAGQATGQIVHIVEPGGARRYFEAPGANASLHLKPSDLVDLCTADTTLLLSTAIPAAAATTAPAVAREVGSRVVVDAAGEPEISRAVLAEADIVRADAEEASALADLPITGWESAIEAGRRLLRASPRLAIVQAPGQGDVVVSTSDEHRLPLLDTPLVDPTGSGDALIATFTVLLAQGETPEHAAEGASAAAARAASQLGAHGSHPDDDESSAPRRARSTT